MDFSRALGRLQLINTSHSDIYSFACVSYEVLCVPVGPLSISHPINFQIFSGLISFHRMLDHAGSFVDSGPLALRFAIHVK